MVDERKNLKDFDPLVGDLVDGDLLHTNRSGKDYKVPASQVLKQVDIISDLNNSSTDKTASAKSANDLKLLNDWQNNTDGLLFTFDTFFITSRTGTSVDVTIPAGNLVKIDSGTKQTFAQQVLATIVEGGGIVLNLTTGVVFEFVNDISTIVEGENLKKYVIIKNVGGVLKSRIPTIHEKLYETSNIVTDLSWLFDNSIVVADPGSGDFRMNNATPGNVTSLVFSKTSHQGIDVEDVLLSIANGSAIQIIQKNNVLKYIIGTAGIVVDNIGYVLVPITITDAGSLFDVGSECSTSLYSESQVGAVENIIANKGVGLNASKPVTGLTIGDIFVSTDTLKKYTATSTTEFDNGIDLLNKQFITDSTLFISRIYQYNGLELLVFNESNGLTSKENISTGISFGGELTINVDPTKFDIAAGEAVIVDSYTNPSTPVFSTITWDAQVGVIVTNIATQLVTFVSVQDDGTGNAEFTQSNVSQGNDENRDKIELGVLEHHTLADIHIVSSMPNWNKDTDLKLLDFASALGRINTKGNVYSPNGTNKQINKSEGAMFAINANYGNDKKAPNYIESAEQIGLTFLTAYGDSGSQVGQNTIIDTDNYNPNGDGGLVPIPDGFYTTHGIFFSPETGLTIVHYGQYLYDSLKKAVDSWEMEVYNVIPELEGVSLRGVIAFAKGTTDLSAPEQAKFINPGAFGFINNKTVPTYSRFAESLELVDGLSYERQDITIEEDSGNLYADIEKIGGGNLTYVFGQRQYTLDCVTGAGVNGKARILLTKGASFSSPAENYISVIKSGDVAILQASTIRPVGEFAYIGKALLPDSVTFLTIGVYVLQRYTDAKEFDGRSSVQRTNERMRVLPAEYEEGMLQTITIDTVPNPDTVDMSITVGKAWQKHLQDTPTWQLSVDGIYIINHPTTPYLKITDLNDIEALQTADGTSLAGTRFNWVIWFAANKSGNFKAFLNLPLGSYALDENAIDDPNRTAVTTIPKEFRGVGLLNARLPFRHRTQNSGEYINLAETILSQQVINLRGEFASVGAGGGLIPASNVFSDDLFRIYDNANLFELAFELANLTANRTLTVPDKDGTIATLGDVAGDLSINRVEPIVVTGSLVIDFASKDMAWANKSTGAGIDVGEDITITAINAANAERDYIFLNVNGATRVITLPTSTIYNSGDTRWNNTTKTLTLPIGVYLLKRVYDGTNQYLELLPDNYKNSHDISFALSDEVTDLTTDNDAEIEVIRAQTIESITLSVNTAPTGSSILVTINKNGSSIQAIELTATNKTVTVANITTLAVGDRIKADITQIGATIAGAGAKIYLKTKLT